MVVQLIGPFIVQKLETLFFLLHSFVKTTNGVDKKAMNTAKQRYKDMMDIVKKREVMTLSFLIGIMLRLTDRVVHSENGCMIIL